MISVLVYFLLWALLQFSGETTLPILRCRGIIWGSSTGRLHCTASDDIAYHCVDLFTGKILHHQKAHGNLPPVKFVARLKEYLAKDDIQGAKAECDRVQGSVASVAKSTLDKYEQMEKDKIMTKEQKNT